MTLVEYIEYLSANYPSFSEVVVISNGPKGAFLYTPETLTDIEHELLSLAVRLYS